MLDNTKKQSSIIANLGNFFIEFYGFLKQLVAPKKIVIVSLHSTKTIPICSKIQIFTVVGFAITFVWLSYVSGKFFAYKSLISSKDAIIWDTALEKRNLEYDISDLRDNLVSINNYFDKINKFDHLSQKNKLAHNNKINQDNKTYKFFTPKDADGEAEKLLFDIKKKINGRISMLEQIIESTGVDNNLSTLGKSIIYDQSAVKSNNNNQGGPFIEFDKNASNNNSLPNSNIDYGINSSLDDKNKFKAQIQYLLKLEEKIHYMPISKPMEEYRLSSGFGKRIDPFTGTYAIHNGLDFIGRRRAPIYSTAPGKIIGAGYNKDYGLMVEIDHGNGIITKYGHMSKKFVAKGQFVKRGEMLGHQGNSGRSSGSHLHYEVIYNNKALNPTKFLEAGTYVF